MTDVYRQFAGILLVLGTLIALLYFFQRRGWASWTNLRMSGDRRMITVLERTRLTPQHTLHLVEIGERRLLVTSSPGSCQLIAELPAGNAGPSASLGRTS